MPSLFQTHQIQGTLGEGPNLLITAGVHGDEYEGMVAIRKLISKIDPKQLRGQLTLVPLVNESAFALRARAGEDGLDLARTCPGRSDGSQTERVAHELATLINNVDYYIDLHTGGSIMQVDPLVGYNLVSDQTILNTQRRMARAFGLPINWGTSAELDGRSLSVARDANVPAIYTEYLGGGLCSDAGVKAYCQGCLNVMAELEMIETRPVPTAPEVVVEDNRPASGHMQICHPSPAAGYFDQSVTLGQSVEKDQPLGRVLDPLGESSHEIFADQSGRLIVLRTSSSVKKGDSLAVILDPYTT
jgi:predicted deacylase|tara:strand:- start:3190 stop:4095 length:906 start_codon:yes stop_codon:yes gene_type:complete